MARKSVNWGCLGLGFILFAVINFMVFLVTGSGVSSRMGHQVSGDLAIFGSIAFFVLGMLSITVWLAIKLFRGMRG
jgi:hypothetical protein